MKRQVDPSGSFGSMLATFALRLHDAEHAIFCQLHFSGRVSRFRRTFRFRFVKVGFRGLQDALSRTPVVGRSTYRRIPHLFASLGRMGHRWYCHMADTRGQASEAAKPRLHIRTNPRQTRRGPCFPII